MNFADTLRSAGARPRLTAERLRDLLHYDPETGVFTWRVQRQGTVKAGDVAGTPHSDGYVVIGVDGGRYRAHRLAWLYMTGGWPRQKIDHLDTVRDNNRFDNLRDETQAVNVQNLRKARRDSKSGLLGASPFRNRWQASIRADGRSINLGHFDTPEEAHAAYIAAKRRLHEGCTL